MAHGERVGNPALEDAAHGLAALIVGNDAPGRPGARRAGFVVVAGGKAAAALKLNRQAAAARLSFRAGDHRAEGDARDSGDGGDR